MAENKKGFILYADLIHTVNKMPNDKAGELFKVILEYVNDNNPVVDDMLVDLVFEPIKRQMKRDLEKYEGVKDKKSEGGRIGNLKRYAEDIYSDYKAGKYTLEEAEKLAKRRKTSHTDAMPSHPIGVVAVTDTVNDTVTVKDKVIVSNTIHSRKLTFSQSTKELFDSDYPNDKHHLDDFIDYWTEHGDNDKKMRFEKEKSFSTTRRVKTWIKNNFNNSNHGTREQNKQTAISIGISNPNL
tara:strand:- start:534 stop:1253 length:720 start_codon:yes stop_codon:yes gene_type:complete